MGANAGMFITAGATISGFAGQMGQANALAAQSQYEARLFEHNADIADLQYRDALSRGRIQASRARHQTRSLIGAQRAAASESGIAVGDGTIAELTAESAFLGELDAERIANDATREAMGFKLQSSDYRRQANLTRTAGRNAARGMRGQAFGTLLTGAAETYAAYKKPVKTDTKKTDSTKKK